MNRSATFIQCIAAAASVVLFSSASYAQHKTAKACEEEWKTNKATIQGSGKTKKAFITECRSGTGQSAAVPPANAAPAPAAPSATPSQSAEAPKTAPAPRAERPVRTARRSTATPNGANEFATEAEARTHCPGQTIVWANTHSKIYHFAGSRSYGNTKAGAYMCENDTASAGIRSAKNEKRPQ